MIDASAECKGSLTVPSSGNSATAPLDNSLSHYEKRANDQYLKIAQLILDNPQGLTNQPCQPIELPPAELISKEAKGVELAANIQTTFEKIILHTHETTQEYQKVNQQLMTYIGHLSSGPSSQTIKEIAKFISDHLAWFYRTSAKSQLIGQAKTDILIGHLKTMKMLLRPAVLSQQSGLAFELHGLITRILPKAYLPEVLEIEIYKHLSAQTPANIQASLNIINTKAAENPLLGLKVMAAWISYNQIPLQNLTLSTIELYKLAPYLTHVSIGNFANWDNARYNHFLQACKQLKSLNIHTDRLIQLPTCVSKLEYLDCSDCPALTSLTNSLPNLQTLKCNRCPALTSLPMDMSALKLLECISCVALSAIPPNLNSLQSLNCKLCRLLVELPEDLNALQILNCFGCANLTALPEGMRFLKELDCSNCVRLSSLPKGMHALLSLSCWSCPLLRSLPADMLALQKLVCFECRALHSLPEMPALQSLHCSHCPLLMRLPAQLSALKRLICKKCPDLSISSVVMDQLEKFNE